jgi:hypothetical protein
LLNATNPSLTIVSAHASDAGTYTVAVSNAARTTTSDPATLTVIDTIAPAITCSSNITTACTSTAGAPVTYTVSATDSCEGSVAVNCDRASGSTFPVGTTTVHCEAHDTSGNTNTCSFTVTVTDSGRPSLTITKSGANATICWPQTCATYVLEESGNLTSWAASSATVTLSGGTYCVTVPDNTGNKFYRLHQQP